MTGVFFAPIARLFKDRGPTYVARPVPLTIVDAIEGVAPLRARPNMRKESLEVVAPRPAHPNTARPVGVKSLVGGIVAPRLGVRPRLIFRRVRLSVRRIGSLSGFTMETAARLSKATSEVADVDLLQRPTIAPDGRATRLPVPLGNHNQTSEPQADNRPAGW